jgi:hypothetical protein
LEELKVVMGVKIGLSPDEFKVMKGISKYKHELRSTEKKLFMCHINNMEKLTLVKGTPLGKNEGLFKFSLFHITDESFELVDLFQQSYDKEITIGDLRPIFLQQFKEWKERPVTEDPEKKDSDPEKKEPEVKPLDPKYDLGDDPSRLRFRVMTAGYPSDVLPDDETMQKASRNLVYTIPQLSVELLPPGVDEGKDARNNQVWVQQFFPENWTLGPKMNFYVTALQEISELREEIKEKTGVADASLSSCEKWDMFNILEIPEFAWYKAPDPTKKTYNALKNVRSLRPRDGTILFFKDPAVELAKLEDDAKKALMEKYKTSKPVMTMTRGTYKEKQLKINQGELDIDEFFDDETTNLQIEQADVVVDE